MLALKIIKGVCNGAQPPQWRIDVGDVNLLWEPKLLQSPPKRPQSEAEEKHAVNSVDEKSRPSRGRDSWVNLQSVAEMGYQVESPGDSGQTKTNRSTQ